MLNYANQKACDCSHEQTYRGLARADFHLASFVGVGVGIKRSHKMLSQKHRGSGFAVGAIGGANSRSAFKSGVLYVGGMNASGLVSARRNGRPGIESAAFSGDIQAVFVVNRINSIPGNLNGSKRIHDNKFSFREFNLGAKHDHPGNARAGNGQAKPTGQQVGAAASDQRAKAEPSYGRNSYAEANATAGSKNFSVSHSSIIPALEPMQRQFLAMKGEN
jgi:hypothetical protein